MKDLVESLFDEIAKIPIVDPHSHVDPLNPTAKSVNDLLGYHYFTELAHSAGLPKEEIDLREGFDQAERIVDFLYSANNTVQYSWFIELAQELFDWHFDDLSTLTIANLFEAAEKKLDPDFWPMQVPMRTNLEAIFLTNPFDDPLEGFDTNQFVPCLRTDDLVFKLHEAEVRSRLASATGIEAGDWNSLLAALDKIFEHFVNHGARAAAVSLPPDFEPIRPGEAETAAALGNVLAGKASADESRTVAYAVFYAIADRCEETGLPFDLMIGVNRDVYQDGVFQGKDLFDQRTSLHQYRRLLNEKSRVLFPISVLTHMQNQELVAFAWIFPNVIANGHWWYSNIPAYIEPDLRARLETVPATKQIGYYSDAYKLEFVLPKFNMYRRCLAKVLANNFVIGRGWSEERAIGLARTILYDNVLQLFPSRSTEVPEVPVQLA